MAALRTGRWTVTTLRCYTAGVQTEFKQLAKQLQLLDHPEGGYYRETYRSPEQISGLPARFAGARSACTAILYALAAPGISRMHRIKSDELWHFHLGSPLEVMAISPKGQRLAWVLGHDISHGQVLQCVVPAGCWFGARVHAGNGYAVVGCTVAPGFEFADFEVAERAALISQFPEHAEIIEALTPA